jgi:hypothetical protein
MSSFQLEWMPGERILLGRTAAGMNIRQETAAILKCLIEALETADRPVPCVLDLTGAQLGFTEMASLLGKLTREGEGAFNHPKLMELVVVTGEGPMRLGVDSLAQAQFGGRKARLFPSVMHALTYTREKYDTMRISPN